MRLHDPNNRLITIFGFLFLSSFIIYLGFISTGGLDILITEALKIIQTPDGPMIEKNGSDLQEIITPYNTNPFEPYNVTGGFNSNR